MDKIYLKKVILSYNDICNLLNNICNDEKYENRLKKEITTCYTTFNYPLNSYSLGKGRKHVLIISNTHGCEIVTPLFVLEFILTIILNDNLYNYLSQKYTFHFIPLLNPDGYIISSSQVYFNLKEFHFLDHWKTIEVFKKQLLMYYSTNNTNTNNKEIKNKYNFNRYNQLIKKLDNKINEYDGAVNFWILLDMLMKMNEFQNVLYILDQYKKENDIKNSLDYFENKVIKQNTNQKLLVAFSINDGTVKNDFMDNLKGIIEPNEIKKNKNEIVKEISLIGEKEKKEIKDIVNPKKKEVNYERIRSKGDAPQYRSGTVRDRRNADGCGGDRGRHGNAQRRGFLCPSVRRAFYCDRGDAPERDGS